MATPEPFPPFNSSADPMPSAGDSNARRRRKSSGLGQEIRAGDTGAPSLGTGLATIRDPSTSSLSSSLSSSSAAAAAAAVHDKDGAKRFSKRRKARSLVHRCKHFALKHTWTLPLVLLVVFGLLFAANPTESNPVHHFVFLSYKLPLEPGAPPGTPHQYAKGLWDVAFVAFYTVVLSFTRELVMQEMLRPLARYYNIRSKGKQARFMEQAYTALYFSILGPAGMYVMSRTPVWYFNTTGMYENFPHKTHEAIFKFYYLFQAAYWAQQAIVLLLGLEEPRKDFKELVGHHIVSLALIGLSYRFHFTYMGLAVYVTHDISDFFLATSKTLNYIDSCIVGPYFFLFMVVWIYLRHYLNLRILWSLFTEFRTVGPFELNWETGQYKCLLSQVITSSLLASLQALNLFWLFFIVRIAYRFVFNQGLEDDRSEAEESEPDEDEVKALAAKDESTPLLNGNGKAAANGGALKARSNGASNKKKAAR